MTRLVPDAVREQLVARISDEADKVDWDHLPQSDKSTRLGQWVDDPAVGGVLRPLVGSDGDVRVWIKEVALKTRSRRQQPIADEVVAALFSGSALVERSSVGIKPHHCICAIGNERHYVCWGVDSNVRNLFWAAVNACFDDPGLASVIIVLVNHGALMTPAHRRKRFQELASCCGVQVVSLSF